MNSEPRIEFPDFDGKQSDAGNPTHKSNQIASGEQPKVPAGPVQSFPSSSPSRLGAVKAGDHEEAQKRLMKLRAFNALVAQSLSPRAAAKQVNLGRATLWRWAQAVAGLDLDSFTGQQTALKKLAAPATKADAKQRGRKCEWDALVLLPDVQKKLREIHAATLAASSDGMTSDRRTGNVAATLKLFTVDPECPEELKPLLLAGKFPVCFTRLLGQMTSEIEALIRGPKHFQLNGFSGRRDKTIGLPDGRRAHLPAGWVIELDDMSVNQPFWVEGPSGIFLPTGETEPILSRQGLYARCIKGRWLAVELVARPREAYTSADIYDLLLRHILPACLCHAQLLSITSSSP